MAFSGGVSWKEIYFSVAILCASPITGGLYYGIGIKVSASTWAALAVSVACLAIPGFNAIYAKCVALISSGSKAIPVLASILGLVPRLVAAF